MQNANTIFSRFALAVRCAYNNIRIAKWAIEAGCDYDELKAASDESLPDTGEAPLTLASRTSY